ncbi:unnamed protein product [Dovyalis caffra]|uniref:Mitochondrial dicarboxylate carrier n=1 Tax=Dovyalis caffra TaxID=77055 RepID=A0AAV1SQ42_9ROSI|nr:unnamed protein product [Dovyalis caffra]
MSKQDGVASLWRGSGLTVNCAMIVTVSQLASYDQAKEMILEKGLMNGGIGTHVTASFVASVASNPIDVIKTRVMNMKVKPGVEPPYKGVLDCAMKTIKAEGPMALYKGFIPTISRQGPFTVVLFITLQQFPGGGERNGMEGIVVGIGIVGIEGMLGNGGNVTLGRVGMVGRLGSGGRVGLGNEG